MSRFTLKIVVLVGVLFGAMLALRAFGDGFASPPWPDGTSRYPKQPHQAERARQAWTSTWERAQVIASASAADESTFWKSDRANFRYWKAWVEGAMNMGYFVNPTLVTNGTLEGWLTQNAEDYSLGNASPWLTTNSLTTICGLADDFWEATPWKGLASNPTNGWPVVTNVMAQLVYTWAQAPSVSTFYECWGYGDSNTSYADAISSMVTTCYTNEGSGGLEWGPGSEAAGYSYTAGWWEVYWVSTKYIFDPRGWMTDVPDFEPVQTYHAFGIEPSSGDSFDAFGLGLVSNEWKAVATATGWTLTFGATDARTPPAEPPYGEGSRRGFNPGTERLMLFYWGGENGFEFK